MRIPKSRNRSCDSIRHLSKSPHSGDLRLPSSHAAELRPEYVPLVKEQFPLEGVQKTERPSLIDYTYVLSTHVCMIQPCAVRGSELHPTQSARIERI